MDPQNQHKANIIHKTLRGFLLKLAKSPVFFSFKHDKVEKT